VISAKKAVAQIWPLTAVCEETGPQLVVNIAKKELGQP